MIVRLDIPVVDIVLITTALTEKRDKAIKDDRHPTYIERYTRIIRQLNTQRT